MRCRTGAAAANTSWPSAFCLLDSDVARFPCRLLRRSSNPSSFLSLCLSSFLPLCPDLCTPLCLHLNADLCRDLGLDLNHELFPSLDRELFKNLFRKLFLRSSLLLFHNLWVSRYRSLFPQTDIESLPKTLPPIGPLYADSPVSNRH